LAFIGYAVVMEIKGSDPHHKLWDVGYTRIDCPAWIIGIPIGYSYLPIYGLNS